VRSILLIEDEPAIADTLVYAFETEHFDVRHALTGGDGMTALEDRQPDCILLDVGLPDGSGFDFCQRIRARSSVPILFLTARDAEIDRILGLELGGDDYVTKPFSPREVVARVRAILRRTDNGGASQPDPAPASRTGGLLEHDPVAMRIRCAGRALELTAHEYKLLLVLLGSPGRVFTRDQLLDRAWDDPGAVTDRTIDAHIKSIRAKLRAIDPSAAELIQTRRGLGYLLVREA
jgi:two-component system catabolic regulation response regulator CreB